MRRAIHKLPMKCSSWFGMGCRADAGEPRVNKAAQAVRELNNDELLAQAAGNKEELFNLRFQGQRSVGEPSGRIARSKKDIARIYPHAGARARHLSNDVA